MYVEGSLDLEVAYYNDKLTVWEPLIEPVIQEGQTHRWELNIVVSVSLCWMEMGASALV